MYKEKHTETNIRAHVWMYLKACEISYIVRAFLILQMHVNLRMQTTTYHLDFDQSRAATITFFTLQAQGRQIHGMWSGSVNYAYESSEALFRVHMCQKNPRSWECVFLHAYFCQVYLRVYLSEWFVYDSWWISWFHHPYQAHGEPKHYQLSNRILKRINHSNHF